MTQAQIMSICFFFRHKAIAIKTRLLSSFFYRFLCIIFIAPALAYANNPTYENHSIYLVYVSSNGVLHQVYRINNIGFQKRESLPLSAAISGRSGKSVHNNHRVFTDLGVRLEDYSPLSGAWGPENRSILFEIDKCFSIYESQDEDDYPKKCNQTCIYWIHIDIDDCDKLKPVIFTTKPGSPWPKEEPLEQIPSLFTFSEIPGIIALDLGLPNTAMMVTLLPPNCKTITEDEEDLFFPQPENRAALKTTRLDQVFCIKKKPKQSRATFFAPSERTIINYDVAVSASDDSEEPSSSTGRSEDGADITNEQDKQQRHSLFYQTDYSKSDTGDSVESKTICANSYQKKEQDNFFMNLSAKEDDAVNKALKDLRKPLKQPQLMFFHDEIDEYEDEDKEGEDETYSRKEKIIYVQANDSFDHIDTENVAIALPNRIGKSSKDPIVTIADRTSNLNMPPRVTVHKWSFLFGVIPFSTKQIESICAIPSLPKFTACKERLNIHIKLYDDQSLKQSTRDSELQTSLKEPIDSIKDTLSNFKNDFGTFAQKFHEFQQDLNKLTKQGTEEKERLNGILLDQQKLQSDQQKLQSGQQELQKEHNELIRTANSHMKDLSGKANDRATKYKALFYSSNVEGDESSILDKILRALSDVKGLLQPGSKLTEETSKNGTESSAGDSEAH